VEVAIAIATWGSANAATSSAQASINAGAMALENTARTALTTAQTNLAQQISQYSSTILFKETMISLGGGGHTALSGLTPTNYYWADVKVSSSSNASTTPTFSKWTTSDLNLVSYTTGGKDIGMRVTGKSNSIGFIVGSSNTNRGIYDYTNSAWII
jgi:hypothetical protein